MYFEIPDEKLAGDNIKYLFEHSDLQKRGNNYFREAIRYFHEPFNIHQESLEDGELHKKLQAITFSIFRASSKERLMIIIEQKIVEWIEKFETENFITNLVDEVRLVITRFVYEVVLENNIYEDKTLIYSQSAINFHKTLKGEELRCIGKHLIMYEDIKRQLEAPNQLRWLNKENLNCHEREILAKHIGGVFFHTGVVQITELICHTLVEIYRSSRIKDELLNYVKNSSDLLSLENLEHYKYLDYVINESLRLFPEFGKTNREVTKRFTIKDITFEEGTVVSLNFQRSHQLHWDAPLTFKPERWDDSSPHATPKEICNSHFIPFGVGLRRCPAEAFARHTTKVAIVTIMKHVNLTIPENFVHTRRLVGGVPTVVTLNTDDRDLRPDFQLNTVSVQDLIAYLEENQHSVDPIDELAGLTFRGTILKIGGNLKYYKLGNCRTFYPLITGIHIWLSFKIKQIKRGLTH